MRDVKGVERKEGVIEQVGLKRSVGEERVTLTTDNRKEIVPMWLLYYYYYLQRIYMYIVCACVYIIRMCARECRVRGAGV